ncbi:MAG: hypothetical protein RLY27_1475, partial [Pseudomonadota bacterium]
VSILKAKDQLAYEPVYEMERGMLEIEKTTD